MSKKKSTSEQGKFWASIWHITMDGPHQRSDDQNKLIKQLDELLESGYPDTLLGDLASLIGLGYEIGKHEKERREESP